MTSFMRGESMRIPLDCTVRDTFAARLMECDSVALTPEQRGKLVIVLEAAHHSTIIMDGQRWWTFFKRLEEGGWPLKVLMTVAEIMYDLEETG